jgi:hypothetical protein
VREAFWAEPGAAAGGRSRLGFRDFVAQCGRGRCSACRSGGARKSVWKLVSGNWCQFIFRGCLEIGVSSFFGGVWKLVSVHFSRKNELTLRHESLGKEEETRTQKPFAGTLRVTNPVRQSLASSRKRVLRGGRRLPLRSVDSQCLGRAIEPRKIIAGVLALVSRGDHAGTPSWRGVTGSAGVEEQGQGTPGIPRNVGDPSVSTDIARLGNRHTNSPEPTAVRPAAGSK